MLPEKYAGFDEQEFLELLSLRMWCLRNDDRRFDENPE
jgi:hypothetical protein